MNMNIEINRGPFFGFIGLFIILFTALKLTGVIAWSWWWVFSPLWILPAIILSFVVFVVVFVVIFIIVCVMIAIILSLLPWTYQQCSPEKHWQ